MLQTCARTGELTNAEIVSFFKPWYSLNISPFLFTDLENPIILRILIPTIIASFVQHFQRSRWLSFVLLISLFYCYYLLILLVDENTNKGEKIIDLESNMHYNNRL